MKRIVIAGMGSAGYAALMSVKKFSPAAEIVVIDPKPRDLRHPCGLPYALEGIVPPDLLVQDIGLDRMKVKKISGALTEISGNDKKVTYSGQDGEGTVEYDSLILCTGSAPSVPPVKGLNCLYCKGIYSLTTPDDLAAIQKEAHTGSRAIIIGAGAIGLETAVALKSHMETVIVLEREKNILPGVLDPDMAALCAGHLESLGIEIRTGTEVEEITGSESFTGVVAGGEKIDGHLGILSTGFKPNCSEAIAAGITCNSFGIEVNSFMETSIPGIYAAGDCISSWSVIDGSKLPVKLATSAYKQGHIAGLNASTGNELEYMGTAATFVSKIGDLEIAGTGFSTEQAVHRGHETASGKIKSGILPEYFPGNSEISIKIIFDKKSGKITGAQAVGPQGAASRINIISTAIEFNIPIQDLGRIELAYCPAVSEVYDPLLRAVDFGLRRIKK